MKDPDPNNAIAVVNNGPLLKIVLRAIVLLGSLGSLELNSLEVPRGTVFELALRLLKLSEGFRKT